MPNVKLFIDEDIYEARKGDLRAVMGPLRESLCKELSVSVAACQLAVIPVMGMEGQPSANLEIQYLGKPERTPAMIEEACKLFSIVMQGALGAVPAVRATPLDPDTYVALK